MFRDYRVSNFQNFKIIKVKQITKLGTQPFQQFQDFELSNMKIILFKDVPIFSCILLNTGSEGPDLVDVLEVPKKCQKVLQYVGESKLAVWE